MEKIAVRNFNNFDSEHNVAAAMSPPPAAYCDKNPQNHSTQDVEDDSEQAALLYCVARMLSSRKVEPDRLKHLLYFLADGDFIGLLTKLLTLDELAVLIRRSSIGTGDQYRQKSDSFAAGKEESENDDANSNDAQIDGCDYNGVDITPVVEYADSRDALCPPSPGNIKLEVGEQDDGDMAGSVMDEDNFKLMRAANGVRNRRAARRLKRALSEAKRLEQRAVMLARLKKRKLRPPKERRRGRLCGDDECPFCRAAPCGECHACRQPQNRQKCVVRRCPRINLAVKRKLASEEPDILLIGKFHGTEGDQRCSSCGRHFGTVSSLNRHKIRCAEMSRNSITNKYYCCDQCGERFATPRLVESHCAVTKHVTEISNVHCASCHAIFTTLGGFYSHNKLKHVLILPESSSSGGQDRPTTPASLVKQELSD